MGLADPVANILRLLGYFNRNQPYGDIINITQRAFCLLSATLLIIPSLHKMIFDAKTFAEISSPLLTILCGASSFAFYLVMLIYRHQILDVLKVLHLKVEERKVLKMFYFWPNNILIREK